MPRPLLSLFVCGIASGLACAAQERPDPLPARMPAVQSWCMQLSGVDRAGAVEALLSAPVDLVVVEPTSTVTGAEDFPVRDLVRRLHDSPGSSRPAKLVLAYINVGQGEDYRTYWKEDWRAPTKGRSGFPEFLMAEDPDGWSGNYPVAFWDPRWHDVVYGSADALVDQVLDAGFDGIYMDWILASTWPPVANAARRLGLDPAKEMERLVRRMREYARERDPDFWLVAQNAAWLIEAHPTFAEVVDGVAHEDLSFRGEAVDDWSSPRGGGIATPAEERLDLARLLRGLSASGELTLTIDYAIEPAQRALAEKRSRAASSIPFVSRTPLDRLPDHLFGDTERDGQAR